MLVKVLRQDKPIYALTQVVGTRRNAGPTHLYNAIRSLLPANMGRILGEVVFPEHPAAFEAAFNEAVHNPDIRAEGALRIYPELVPSAADHLTDQEALNTLAMFCWVGAPSWQVDYLTTELQVILADTSIPGRLAAWWEYASAQYEEANNAVQN